MNRISKLLTKSSLIMKIRTMNYGTCRTLLFAGLCLSNVCLSAAEDMNPDRNSNAVEPVSYTHLTLPTNREV